MGFSRMTAGPEERVVPSAAPPPAPPSLPPACQLCQAACRALGTFSGQEGRGSHGGLGLFLYPSRASRPQRPGCPRSGMLMIRDEPTAAQLALSPHVHRCKTTLLDSFPTSTGPGEHRGDSLPTSTGPGEHRGDSLPTPSGPGQHRGDSLPMPTGPGEHCGDSLGQHPGGSQFWSRGPEHSPCPGLRGTPEVGRRGPQLNQDRFFPVDVKDQYPPAHHALLPESQ